MQDKRTWLEEALLWSAHFVVNLFAKKENRHHCHGAKGKASVSRGKRFSALVHMVSIIHFALQSFLIEFTHVIKVRVKLTSIYLDC